VVACVPGDIYRAGRTLRALDAAGLRAVDATRAGAPCPAEDGKAAWILRAGAWPRQPERLRFPERSQTGRPLLALGAVFDAPGFSSEGAGAWRDLLARSGGDLTSPVAPVPPLESVFLSPPLGRTLRDHGTEWPRALRTLLTDPSVRRVRYAPLDVVQDERWRVAEAITSFHRGGAERVVIDLAATLPSRNTQVTVLTVGRPLRGAFPAPPQTIDLSAVKGGRAARMEAAAHAARAAHADLVHAHLFAPEDLLPFRAAALPLLLTVHNARPGWPPGSEALTRKHGDLLSACSRFVEAELRAADVDIPARTAWNGIDRAAYASTSALQERAAQLRRSWGIPAEDAVVLALANPRRQKRLHLLPEVLRFLRARLKSSHPPRDAWLVIAGESSPGIPDAQAAEQALGEAIARSGEGARIRRLTGADEIPPLMHAADALLSMSAWEGLSLAHMEALASGIQVVATAAGGTAELAAGPQALTLLPLDCGAEPASAALAHALGSGRSRGSETLSADFCRYRMAERYESLFPRAIQLKRRRDRGNPDEPPALWLVMNNLSTGGAQSSARRLFGELARRGVAVRTAVVQEQPDHPTPGRSALEAAGVRTIALPPPPPYGDADPLEAVQELLAQMDSEDRPVTVVMWNLLQEYKVLLADLLIGVPIFDVSPGEMYFASLERYFERPRPGLPYRSSRDYGARLAGVIVKYETERAQAQSALGTSVFVIPNGVPVAAHPPRPRPLQGPLIFGTAARLSPQKKLEELFAAFRDARARLPEFVLKIAGGPESGSEAYAVGLKQEAAGLPVEWVGAVQDSEAFLESLDAFVMISEPAGCPNASLEAMAAGLAVIATDHGGVAEQIVDGHTGRLTPRGDPAALAAALVDAATDRVRLGRWGDAGRDRIRRHFSLARMADAYSRVLLPQHGGEGRSGDDAERDRETDPEKAAHAADHPLNPARLEPRNR
jgi:glycosyltransferase involved in cell wall biosynthesis